MSIPTPLKRLRSQLHFSQAQVATKMGVSQPTYQRWESGAAPIPEGKVKKLAKVLHSTPEVLTGADRYARASLSMLSGADGYWGEVAIHFVSGSEPVVLGISASERDRLAGELQTHDSEFVEVVGLCNEHYLIRRHGISEAYLSDEAAERLGAPEDDYPHFMRIQLVDDRLWDVLSNFNQKSDSLEKDFPPDDIVEALSHFMGPSEITESLSAQIDEATPAMRTGIEAVIQEVSKQAGVATEGVYEVEDREDLEFRKNFLLSRASDTVVRLGCGVERRFILREAEDLSATHALLTSLAPGRHEMFSFRLVDAAQVALFRTDALEFVRFPKHYLERAVDGTEMNTHGYAGVEDED